MNINRLAMLHDRVFHSFSYLTSLLLFVMRWHWGALLMKAGAGKIAAPEKIVPFFDSLGIPFPEFNVFLVSHVEYYFGALIMIGLASRIVAVPLLITMVTAMATAHLDAFWMSFPSWNPIEWNIAPIAAESPFNYILMLLFVLALGPGKISVDAGLKYFRERAL